MAQNSSVALLVDGDNISSVFAGQILRKTGDLGQHVMRLVFCNSQSLTDWSAAQSFRAVYAGSGKNGADLVLSIRAIEFALRDGIDIFAIASSDGDLSHVAHRLRELGRVVIGLGEEKAPKTFRLACSRFIVMAPPAAKIPDQSLGRIDKVVRRVFDKKDPHGQGLAVNRLNEFVRKEDASIKISECQERNWLRYLSQRPDLYALVGEGPDRRVRIAAKSDEG